MRHMKTTRTAAILIALAIAGAGGLVVAQQAPKKPAKAVVAEVNEDDARSKNELTYEMLNLFGDVFERVRENYVEEVKDDELIENAINGMLSALDPHSSYLNAKGFKEMQVQTKGEFGGLGIEVTMDSGLVKVVSPIDDTPAFNAGIKAGDYISHIDDEPVMGLALSEAVEKMRGPVDSKIKLTVLREGQNEPLNFTLKRDVIRIQSVKADTKGKVGYVRVTSFSENTYEKMRGEIEKMQKEMPDMQGIVLDLRNNPGGLLDQAVLVSDAFLNQGEIVSTRGRDPAQTRRYSAKQGDMLQGKPIVVLINGGSASASEIVAGALKDHRRAIIMGTKSFGKGSVQTVIPLPGHGAMRLTTSRYYTPSGTSIQAQGITPDVKVVQAEVKPIEENMLSSEADLRGHLENLEQALDKAPANDNKAPAPFGKTAATKGKEGDKDEPLDYQLERALDLLRGLAIYRENQAG